MAGSPRQVPTVEFGKHVYDFDAILGNRTPRTLHMWGYPFNDYSIIKRCAQIEGIRPSLNMYTSIL